MSNYNFREIPQNLLNFTFITFQIVQKIFSNENFSKIDLKTSPCDVISLLERFGQKPDGMYIVWTKDVSEMVNWILAFRF